MDNKLSDNMKKILLAGIGAMAITAEKSKDILDEMVKKGELTVEQGKVLNEELKHTLKNKVKKEEKVHKEADAAIEFADIAKGLDKLSKEQLSFLKEEILKRVDSEKSEETAEEKEEEEAKNTSGE